MQIPAERPWCYSKLTLLVYLMEMLSRPSRMGYVALAAVLNVAAIGQSIPNLFPISDATGTFATYNDGDGPINTTGAFFQSLGTNGRSCNSCHVASAGWSVSPPGLQNRFNGTQGLDPVFRTNDGSVCDNVDTSTVQARRQAYRLLLSRGLFRIALAVPASAEFTVVSVVNQYGCGDPATLSLYRRPLPATNLRFLASVMWDGRESMAATGTTKITFNTNPSDLISDLAQQALDATNGHAQATTPLTVAQQQDIVNFELALSTAQLQDNVAGPLNANGVSGGPEFLGTVIRPAFYVGENDPAGRDPKGAKFTPSVFHLYDAWSNVTGGPKQAQQASIARGEKLFNTKEFNINNARNFCGTCHDSQNAGTHSLSLPLNTGTSSVQSPLDVSYLPVITLQNKTTFKVTSTTDPGFAMFTGRWNDIGKLKIPGLRGLAAHPPYFHNGSAQTLADVVTFYNKQFNIGFTAQDEADLVAFLQTL